MAPLQGSSAVTDDIPETKYATLGEDRIAYQIFGDGDIDLVYMTELGACIDLRWQWPSYARFLRRLGQYARVIMFDQRGSGASDYASGESLPIWERWAEEALAMLDVVGSERAVIFGTGDAGPTAILFAASHAARTRGLILGNTTPRFSEPPKGDGIPEEFVGFIEDAWGTEAMAVFAGDESARDPAYRHWHALSQRLSLRPRDLSMLFHFEQSIDVRDALALVRVPTLVLHRERYKLISPEQGRYLASHIPQARFELIPGGDGSIYTEPMDETLRHIEAFLRGLHLPIEPDRALAAILFTDIVASTERASALGDREWRTLLETHDAVTQTVVQQHRGKLVKMTGDGMLATFDGPGRAIRCAIALGKALRPLGLEIRAGLHTGEVEVRETDIAGIGVHIAARVLSSSSPGEVWVSAAVPMLVAGSGFEFEDRGEHELKGVPGSWKLYAVQG
jgi:class 3 adenylate cyclase